jgi:hypothetical protein
MRRGVVLIGMVIAGACLAVLAGTGGSDRPAPHSGTSVTAVEGGVALVDRSGVIRSRIPPTEIAQAYEARFEAGLFWVFDPSKPAIDAIDPQTGRIARSLRSPVADVGSYLVTHDVLWITDEQHGTLVAIDPHTGETMRAFRHLPGSGGSEGVALVGGSLWVARPEALQGNGILAILDPRTGGVTGQIRKQPGSYELAADPDGTLWAGGAHGAVDHIRPRSRSVALIRLPGRNYSIAVGDRHLWTTDVDTGTVYELDGGPAVVARYATAAGADTVSFADHTAWVGNSQTGTLTRISPPGRPRTYAFDHAVTSVAAGDGLVLVGFGKALSR